MYMYILSCSIPVHTILHCNYMLVNFFIRLILANLCLCVLDDVPLIQNAVVPVDGSTRGESNTAAALAQSWSERLTLKLINP